MYTYIFLSCTVYFSFLYLSNADVEYTNLDHYRIVFWSGDIEDSRMLLHTYKKKVSLDPFQFHRYISLQNKDSMRTIRFNKSFIVYLENSIIKNYFSAMVMTKDKSTLYACTSKEDYRVIKYMSDETSSYWEKAHEMPRAYNDNVEYLLQLKLDREEEMLLATTGNGFIVWFLESKSDAHVLMLPNGVRNISTRMMCSNSVMISSSKNYAVAGVRYEDC